MGSNIQHKAADRLLVVMPTWVGDNVMAMPTLRALRELYPKAHISALVRANVKPIIESCPWIDRILTIRQRRKGLSDARRGGLLTLAARIAAGKFDTAVLLPNSFRSALIVRLAGIPRRVGYNRDGRATLLTDRLLPLKSKEGFIPTPTLDYYLSIAAYLGSPTPSKKMSLFTRPSDDQRALQLLRDAGADIAGKRLVIINPGANFGDAKIWNAERFAQVADRCITELNATVAITGSPKERTILDAVLKAAKEPLIDLSALGMDLTLLKSIVKHSSLMITNDTGPRHIAAALDVPVVTIFGPTDPAWTLIDFAAERQVRVDVYCGPCQKKLCPLRHTPDNHICMKRVTVDMVFEKASELLGQTQSAGSRGEQGR